MKRLLFAVLFVALMLRVVDLNKFPYGFTPDEASFGYDAYSILKTGKDQWGKNLPLVLQSFGDYKSPLYAYISIPFVAIFGLSKFSIRLPNALVGVGAVYITYLLVYQIAKNNYLKFDKNIKAEHLALAASFLLAISPWHVMISRGAFEANLTTLLLPLALYFFFKALKNPRYFIYSALAVGLDVFSYHAAKLVVPLLFLFLFIIFRKEIVKGFGIYHKLGIFVLAVFIGLFLISLRGGSSTRVLDVSIFKTSLAEASSERIKAISEGMNPFTARLIYNKYGAGIRHFFSNYITYFSPQFYFSQGPAESTYGMIPGRGVLYWFELPFIILGLFYLLKNISNKYALSIIIWYLLSPVAAALSLGPGYAANRASVSLPSIQIISALGLIILLNFVSNFKYKKICYLFGGTAVFIFFFYFVFDYFFISPQKTAEGMLYGNYEAAEYVSDYYSKDEIIMSRKLSEPHIYVAFVNKWDPENYQQNTKNWDYKKLGLGWVDQIPRYTLGNYVFENILQENYMDKNVILVGKPDEFLKDTSFNKLILYPNNNKAVAIVDTFSQRYAWKN